jgi:hypothetical protein
VVAGGLGQAGVLPGAEDVAAGGDGPPVGRDAAQRDRAGELRLISGVLKRGRGRG